MARNGAFDLPLDIEKPRRPHLGLGSSGRGAIFQFELLEALKPREHLVA
jgi:hypothetical protein